MVDQGNAEKGHGVFRSHSYVTKWVPHEFQQLLGRGMVRRISRDWTEQSTLIYNTRAVTVTAAGHTRAWL